MNILKRLIYKLLGIKSPSKLFKAFDGVQFRRGFMEGFNKGRRNISGK